MGSSISDLLDALQQISERDQEKLDAWCDELCRFYERNGRHSYAEITKYIISSDGGVEYMERILPVLEKLREQLRQEENPVYANVGKLIDHIRLELLRIKYINETSAAIATETFISLNNDLLGQFDVLHSTMQGELEALERTAMLAAKKVENAQSEVIAILGIFAAVVLAFVSGIAFSTSVLQNISNASIYKIVFVSCGIALVLVNLVYMLLRFIMEIKDTDAQPRTYPQYLKRLDCLLAAVAGLTAVLWFFDIRQLAVIVQSILYS